MRLSPALLMAVLGTSAVAACYSNTMGSGTDGTVPIGTRDASVDGNAGPPADGGSPAPSGLPCNIDALLKARCQSCHDSSHALAPMALVTYDDVMANWTNGTVAQASLAEMQSGTMPPAGSDKPTAQEMADFQAWINQGEPRGTCGQADGGTTTADAGQVAPVCTSGLTWTSTAHSAKMNPGLACMSCHGAGAGGGGDDDDEDDDDGLQIGGTVYPTLHEPDKCYGAAGAQIVVTDANGATVTLTTGSTGNFSLSTEKTKLAFPIDVKVVSSDGKTERPMPMPATSGDCNSCHDQSGNSGAYGRVTLP